MKDWFVRQSWLYSLSPNRNLLIPSINRFIIYLKTLPDSNNISKENCYKIAVKIREEFYKPRYSIKTSVFLCGADLNDVSTVRFKLAEAFSDWYNKYYYDLIYPEDMFDELLYARNNNLLALENMLAESIDVIVLIPESPGSYTELGAFVNSDRLRTKILCLVDEKYKKKKSFINQGPIKLLKEVDNNRVVYIDPSALGKDISKIHRIIKEIKKATDIKDTDHINLLQLDNFLLPTIYLLEPVSRDTLIACVAPVVTDKLNAAHFVTVSLGIMVKKKLVELTLEGYKLTKLGVKSYFDSKKISSRIKSTKKILALDLFRLEILNLKLRNKALKI